MQNLQAKTVSEITPAVAAFLNTLPLMMRVCDAGGRSLWFSPNWLDFTGRSPEDELGGWTADIHPGDVESVPPELATRVRNLLDQPEL